MKPAHVRWLAAVISLMAMIALVSPLPAADRARADRDSKAKVVRGKVVRADASSHQITIRTRSGEEITLHVDDRSALQLDHQNVGLDQVKEGTRVRVVCEQRDGKDHLVSLTTPTVGPALKAKLDEVIRELRKMGFDQKKAYEDRLDSALHDADNELDQLEDKADSATGAVKQDYEREIQKLRERRQEVRAQLDRVRNATAASWEEVKTGVARALDDMQRALDQARSRFR